MIKKVFSVYDEKSQAYLQPFFLDTTGQAIRAITDCVDDIKHQFNRHTSDYSLHYLAEYDDSTGLFSDFDNRQSLGNLVEFKTPQKEIGD